MEFNATFNNISVISWWSVLLVEETVVPRENHRPVKSQWQTLSHNIVSSAPRHQWDSNTPLLVIGTDFCTGSCKSNFHMITKTMAPKSLCKYDYMGLWKKNPWNSRKNLLDLLFYTRYIDLALAHIRVLKVLSYKFYYSL
jgi:hypothetical protein